MAARKRKTKRDHTPLGSGHRSLKPVLNGLYRASCFAPKWELQHKETKAPSSILFEGLKEKITLLSHQPSANLDTSGHMEELMLLLRCFFLVIKWSHQHDLTLTLTQKLLNLDTLRCPLSVPSAVSTKILEVILDEMFEDKIFWGRIVDFYPLFSTRENSRFFTHIESMIEFIATHFLLSLSREKALENFTLSLHWTGNCAPCRPELSLPAAISLVKHPVLSSSVLIRVHLISLLSDVIGINVSPGVRSKVDCVEYMSVFQDSVVMYREHMSNLLILSWGSLPFRKTNLQRAFERLFESESCNKINAILAGSDSLWEAQTMPSSEHSAICYLKMNLYTFEESSREGVFSLMSSLLSTVLSVEVDETMSHRLKQMTVGDFFLLAAILKLMSCSLLQAISSFKKRFSSSESSSLGKKTPEYSSLVSVFSCFGQCNLLLPSQVQLLIVDHLKHYGFRHGHSRTVVTHFAGLLYLCASSGLDFLLKGCLFAMLVIVDTIIFEEDSSEFLRSLNLGPAVNEVEDSSINVASDTTDGDSSGICGKEESSIKTALSFRRTREQVLRGPVEELDEEMTDGREYLKIFIKNYEEVEDFDDLAGFIACKNGKDYKSWLVCRYKSYSKRRRRSARKMWNRKKKAWHSVAGVGKKRV